MVSDDIGSSTAQPSPVCSLSHTREEGVDHKMEGSATSNVTMVGTTEVTRYIPPNPPVGDGPHRLASFFARGFTRKKEKRD